MPAIDQSSTLRRMVAERDAAGGSGGGAMRVLSVTSGKGGVGKSNLALNVSIALAKRRNRVLLLDADMGLANVDILVGLTARRNLSHVMNGEADLDEVIQESAAGIHILPAASGVEWMANLTAEQKLGFLQKMDEIGGRYDVLMIDTGAGISANVVYFNLAAQQRIVVVTPEPTSLTDAYALIKVLNKNYQQKTFEVVVNNVKGEQSALSVYKNLTAVTDRFLDVRVGYLGYVRQDDALGRAVLRQEPVIEAFPDADISRCYRDVARQILRRPPQVEESNLGLFWRKIMEAPTP